jgi:hypothetical protein
MSSKSSKSSGPIPLNELQRKPSADVTSASSRSNVIQAFINYVAIRGEPGADSSNIVSKLISVMNNKKMFGGKINLSTNVMKLYKTMFNLKITRPEIFEILQGWCNITKKQKVEIKAGSLRNLTVYSNLSEITRIGDPNQYIRDSDSIDVDTAIGSPLGEKELNFCNDIWPDLKIKSGKKFQCGICWICTEPIHFFYATYNYGKKKLESGFLNASCGEDEHLIPAGSGNMFGTISHDFEFSKSIVQDKTSLMNMGLRASHTWCNRCKTDYSFINPPQIGAGYTLNYHGILTFKQMAIKWTDNANIKHFSNEVQFSQYTSPESRRDLVNKMEQSIVNTITNLCNMANSLVTTSSSSGSDIYTAFLLRMIWNGCLLCTTLFPSDEAKKKWSETTKKGGKYQYGGATADEIFDNFFEIVSNPISDEYEESGEDLLELDNIFFPTDSNTAVQESTSKIIIGNESTIQNKTTIQDVIENISERARRLRAAKKEELRLNEITKNRELTKIANQSKEREERRIRRAANIEAQNAAAAANEVDNVSADSDKSTNNALVETISPTETHEQIEKKEIEQIVLDRSEIETRIGQSARAAARKSDAIQKGYNVDDVYDVENINILSKEFVMNNISRLQSESSETKTFFVESTDPPQYSFKQKGDKGYLCNMITGACSIVLLSAVALGAAKLSGVFGGKKTKNKKNKMKTQKTTKKTSKKRRTKNHKMKIKKQSRKRTKGGELQLDDPYKNSEGSQY